MHRIRSKIINNQSGVTALLMLVLMLASILTVTLSAGEIIRNGLKMGNLQYNATKAYFAAEAGAERILYELRKSGYDFSACSVPPPECVSFTNTDALDASNISLSGNSIQCDDCLAPASFIIQQFSNKTHYHIEYNQDGADTVLRSVGTYKDVSGEYLNRVVELRY